MPKLSTLSIGNGAFHEAETFELRNLKEMESIEIGNNKFNKVKSLIIDGLNELKELKIGSNSFTGSLNSYGNDASNEFIWK